MGGTIKVKNGGTETDILKKNLQHYLDNGWAIVEEEVQPKSKDYDKFTVAQLKSICRNRNILPNKNARKAVMIDVLIKQDEQSKLATGPSNKGFTDNLIIE